MLDLFEPLTKGACQGRSYSTDIIYIPSAASLALTGLASRFGTCNLHWWPRPSVALRFYDDLLKALFK